METKKIIPLVISIVGIALGALGFFIGASLLAFIALIVSVMGLVLAIKQKFIIAVILAIAGMGVSVFSIYQLAENVIWLV